MELSAQWSTMERKYIAFISYRHCPLDASIARQLHKLIERYTIPFSLRKNTQKKLGIVFRDQEELAASNDLSQEICKALDCSEFLIVICTRDTPNSVWVDREIRYFLRSHSRSNVLTVLADGEPPIPFPRALTHIYDNASGKIIQTEPMAVDVRAKHTFLSILKLRKECKKLFAAIIKCPYDALVLREQRRRFTRIMAGSVVAFAIVTSFILMLLSKNYEIGQKNLELAREKANVQYQQAQLLTEDAEAALTAGDFRTAIQGAIQALPNSEEPDRPYYAPAENVLFEAMNLFGTEYRNGRLYDTALEQMTPISDFCISDDGAKVITIDAYGTLQCFDTLEGTPLWSNYIRGSNVSSASKAEKVMPCGSGHTAISFYHGNLACYSLDTGDLLWERDIGNAVDDYLFYHGGQDILLYAEKNIDDYLEFHAINLTVLSGKTGEILHTIPFPQTEHLYRCVFPDAWGDDFSAGGAFSSDGTLFFSAYIQQSVDYESGTLTGYVVDLAKGTAQICFRKEIEGLRYGFQIADIQLADQGMSLVITFVNDATITVEKINLAAETSSWSTNIPAEYSSFSSKTTFTQIFSSSLMYVANGTKIHCLDMKTGALLDTAQAPSEITGLYTVSNTTIGFFMEDGTYAIGWKNPSRLHLSTDSGIEVFASVGWFLKARNYGGGILQEQESKISISNRVSEGFAAVIPAGEKQKVIIKRPSEPMHCIDELEIQIPLEKRVGSTVSAVFWDNNSMIVGPFSEEAVDHYAVIDLHSHSVVKILDVRKTDSNASLFFMEHGAGYVMHTSDGAVIRSVGGVPVQLAPAEEIMYREDGSIYYMYGAIRCDAAYLTDSRNILTARLGTDTLTIWLDGEQIGAIPLPENQIFSPDSTNGYHRFLKVGKNGDILIGNAAQTESSDLAVFHRETGSWIPFQDTVSVPNEAAIAMSNAHPHLAFVDSQDLVWVYDYVTENLISSFPLGIPRDAVSDMQFFMEDSCLMVRTKYKHLLIYDIAAGTMVYRDQLGVSQGGQLHAFVDEGNQRLYIADKGGSGNPNGFCIDLRTWTKLSSIDSMLFYDATRNALYQWRADGVITVRTIPSTSELISLGEELLSRNENAQPHVP